MRISSMRSRARQRSLWLCCLFLATNVSLASAQQTGPGVLPGTKPASAGGDISASRVLDGSADGTAVGGYSWTNDTNTVIYRIGADNVGFSAGGTLRWDYNTTRILSTIPFVSPLFATGLTSGDVGFRDSGDRFQIVRGDQGALMPLEALGVFSTGEVRTTTSVNWDNGTFLFADAANTLAQRNGTNAQVFRLYQTFTDGSNYRRLVMDHAGASSRARLYTTWTGTGTAFDLGIGSGTEQWYFANADGAFIPITNNASDLGTASFGVRTGYFGTSVISQLFRSDSAKVLIRGTGTGATQLAATQTTVPTCSSNCGTDPVVAGSDTFMTVTMGTSGSPASGWVVTFNGTWAAAPSCTVQMAKAGMAVGKLALTAVTTTTTITVVTNGTAPATTDMYHIHCGGLQ